MKTIEFYIERYCESLKICHYAKETIRKHKRNIEFFCDWAAQRSLSLLANITRGLIEDYLIYLFYYQKENGESFSVGARCERIISLKLFFSWSVKENAMIYNHLSEIELPKRSKSIPREVLSETEMIRILGRPDLNTPQGLRDRAILETFYSTGIRRAELVNLSLYDLNKERGILLVRQGKGKKDRVVPIGERALEWVGKYLEHARPKLQSHLTGDTLFLSITGVKLKSNSLTTLMRDYIKGARVNKSGSCHIFRHTMATLMMENGADLRYIQEMLGHSELRTTQIYTRVSIKKLHEVYKRTHPGCFGLSGFPHEL